MLRKKTKSYLDGLFEKYNPNLVISVQPNENHLIIDYCNLTKTPFLLITTDIAINHWLRNFEKVDKKNLTIVTLTPSTNDSLLKSKNITDKNIKVLGLPVSNSFKVNFNKDKIKSEFNISHNKKVIMLLFGANGSSQLLKFMNSVDDVMKDLHLIVCCGKDEALLEKAKNSPLHRGNSATYLGFTNRIAELMAASDLIITKPGPATLFESMLMRLPIIIDATAGSLIWERANMEYVVKNGVGSIVRSMDQLPILLKEYLYDKRAMQSVSENYDRLPAYSFDEKLASLIIQKLANKTRSLHLS